MTTLPMLLQQSEMVITISSLNAAQSVHELNIFPWRSAIGRWRLLPEVHAQSYSQVLWIKAILSQLHADCFAANECRPLV